MKTCVIDTGGGLRGIFGAGVLDRCMKDGVVFDLCIGVSAGSANIAAYTAGQQGRNYAFYCDYSFRKEYMSAGNLMKTGSYIGLDYIYRTLSNEDGENPLDYDAISAYPGELKIVATRADSGNACYFGKEDMKRNDYGIICASCAIPAVCRPYTLSGTEYFDGGVADPVPLEYALSLGAEKTVLILTRPLDFVMSDRLETVAGRLLSLRYPEMCAALKKRKILYEEGVKLAKELEKEGKCLIIAPDDCCGVETLTRDKERLDRLYRMGFDKSAKITSYLC